MTIVDYAIKFEQLYFKTKSFKMEILNGTVLKFIESRSNWSRLLLAKGTVI